RDGQRLARLPPVQPALQLREFPGPAVADKQGGLEGAGQAGGLEQQPARLGRGDDDARGRREERPLEARRRAVVPGERARGRAAQAQLPVADAPGGGADGGGLGGVGGMEEGAGPPGGVGGGEEGDAGGETGVGGGGAGGGRV